jgi:hypothetical protein
MSVIIDMLVALSIYTNGVMTLMAAVASVSKISHGSEAGIMMITQDLLHLDAQLMA